MVVVYKYLSPDLKECYVGSTVNEISRKSMHKSRRYDCKSKLLFDKYGYDNCSYVVLEVCPVEERHIKEQWWLDHAVGVVNRNRTYRTEDQIKAYNESYRESRRELFKDRARAYREANKEAINKQRKAYREANREVINEKKRIGYKIKTTVE